MLRLLRVSRSFREGGRKHVVLTDVEAHIAPGEIVAILGRSGSGKSTLLNLISGIDHPDTGIIEIDNQTITSMREPARTLFRRRMIGFVYQFFHLIPTLNVEENVRLVLELNGVGRAAARVRTRTVLEEVGLGDRLASAPDVLSGGEQQRVAIARALVHEPALLLADEPIGNLDEQTARQVTTLLLNLVRQRRTTLLIATHSVVLAMAATRRLELRDGRLHDAVEAPAARRQ